MDWENLLLAVLLFVCIIIVLGVLDELIPPKKLFMSQAHNGLYFWGLPLIAIFNNYDVLSDVSWGYFIGLSIGVGFITFFVLAIMNQITGFVSNLEHNKDD